MKYSLTAAALLAATASADFCSLGSVNENGNCYCQPVTAITYTGVGSSNSYNKITSMNSGSDSCESTPYPYDGSLAPLNEEVSLHFRGPIKLSKFAFYTSSGTVSSSAATHSAHERRHTHAHGHAGLHKRQAQNEGANMVSATINGVVQSWVNNYFGGSPGPVSNPSYSPGSAPNSHPDESTQNKGSGRGNARAGAPKPIVSASTSNSNQDDSGNPPTGSGWTRQGYYDAEGGVCEGIVFMNHEGGTGSGVFDYTFGNSLSYSSSDGKSAASSPQCFSGSLSSSEEEIIIMTDRECIGDSCDYYREGTVAHHGFDGSYKAFFFEFEMPSDGATDGSQYHPADMPAIWMLNAQIPRTLQYGNANCSCWSTGCGEFDIFEVLSPGDQRCKSTLHSNISGGSSDYFPRPMNGPIKATLLMFNNNIHIKIIDDFDFGESMDSTWVTEICQDTLNQSKQSGYSVFNFAENH